MAKPQQYLHFFWWVSLVFVHNLKTMASSSLIQITGRKTCKIATTHLFALTTDRTSSNLLASTVWKKYCSSLWTSYSASGLIMFFTWCYTFSCTERLALNIRITLSAIVYHCELAYGAKRGQRPSKDFFSNCFSCNFCLSWHRSSLKGP